jgi:hypothetical protein
MNTVSVVVFTTFINFINSFRFDTSFNFLLYILNTTSEIKIFALWNRIPLFFNGQLVLSLSYLRLLVCKCMYHYDIIK